MEQQTDQENVQPELSVEEWTTAMMHGMLNQGKIEANSNCFKPIFYFCNCITVGYGAPRVIRTTFG